MLLEKFVVETTRPEAETNFRKHLFRTALQFVMIFSPANFNLQKKLRTLPAPPIFLDALQNDLQVFVWQASQVVIIQTQFSIRNVRIRWLLLSFDVLLANFKIVSVLNSDVSNTKQRTNFAQRRITITLICILNKLQIRDRSANLVISDLKSQLLKWNSELVQAQSVMHGKVSPSVYKRSCLKV